jgi:lysosomal alpha-mannosidase
VKDLNKNNIVTCLDRSHGGGSIHDGSVEIMVHRRILTSDSSDVAEPLNETAYGQGLAVRGRHLLVIGSLNMSAVTH